MLLLKSGHRAHFEYRLTDFSVIVNHKMKKEPLRPTLSSSSNQFLGRSERELGKKTAGIRENPGGLLDHSRSAYFMNTIFLVAENSSVSRR